MRDGRAPTEVEAVDAATYEVGSFFVEGFDLFHDGADGDAGQRSAADVLGGEGFDVFCFYRCVGDGFLIELDEVAVGLKDAGVELRGLFKPGVPIFGDLRPVGDGILRIDTEDYAELVREGAVGSDDVGAFFEKNLRGDGVVWRNGGGRGAKFFNRGRECGAAEGGDCGLGMQQCCRCEQGTKEGDGTEVALGSGHGRSHLQGLSERYHEGRVECLGGVSGRLTEGGLFGERRFGEVEVDEDGGFDQEHAEGCFLTVPCGGLPHEEPLAADGDG